jgi:hypothetical protein
MIMFQIKLTERVNELIQSGYLIKGSIPNTIVLSPKGLQFLMAEADPPINKSDLKKDVLPPVEPWLLSKLKKGW